MIKKKSLPFAVSFYLLLCTPAICQSTAPPPKFASFYQPQSTLIALGAGGCLLLVGFLSFTFYRTRIKQKVLTNQKQELENRIGQLQKNYELQNDFFSVTSHDLRNPIAGLKNALTLLKSKAGYRNELDMLEQNVNALYLTLDNITYWSLLQRNDLPFFPRLINLSDIMDDAIEEFDSLIRHKKVTIRFDQQSASMWMDEAVILLILRNILFYTLTVSRTEEIIFIRIRQESIRTDIIITKKGKGQTINELLPDQGTGKQPLHQGLVLSEELMKHCQGHLSINNKVSHGMTITLSWSLIHAARK